jgi:hypothetical protein
MMIIPIAVQSLCPAPRSAAERAAFFQDHIRMTPREWTDRFHAEDLVEAVNGDMDGGPIPFANWLAVFEPLIRPLDKSVLEGARLPDLSSEMMPPNPRKVTNEALSQAFKVRVELADNIAPEDLQNRAMDTLFHTYRRLPELQQLERIAQIARIIKKELDAWPGYIARYKDGDIQQAEAKLIHRERTRCLNLIKARDDYLQRIGEIANVWYREGLKDVQSIIRARG